MVTKKILVTGSSGQLATEIFRVSKNYNQLIFYFFDKDKLDITSFDDLLKVCSHLKVDYIINCAAFTDVELAETKKDLANLVNHLSIKNLVKVSNELDIGLIHISTDYVFDGLKNSKYSETDKTNPINYYGKTKLLGEKIILNSSLKNSIIIRTSWLYSFSGNNFFTKILNQIKSNKTLKIVSDEIGTPTLATDFAFHLIEILMQLSNDKPEIYHYANSESCSRFEFVNEIVRISSKKANIVKTNKNKINSVERPSNSSLDNSKIIAEFNIEINPWKTSLKNMLSNNL